MNPKTEYKLASGLTVESVEKQVNFLIEEGWLIYGSIAVFQSKLIQAMIKVTHEQNNPIDADQ